MKHILEVNQPFQFEFGGEIPSLKIVYHTYGQLNADKNNVIWICHALTASSDVADWWSGLVGEGKVLDTTKYFIVCVNILGSCYGTTGPSSAISNSEEIFGINFPFFTIRDMVKVHQMVQRHLGIHKIQLLMGGSMGGYQVLEWLMVDADLVENVFLIATSAEESAWGKAIHSAQRLAIEADPNWKSGKRGFGDFGLKAARGIGMLTYRNYELFKAQQSDSDVEMVENHKADSYIRYQAQKLADRFDALTYYKLTQAMDSHQLARNRMKSIEVLLQEIYQPTLIMGISSDILCPTQEQDFLAKHIHHSDFYIINSTYGHDGFLIESEQIGTILRKWIQTNSIFK